MPALDYACARGGDGGDSSGRRRRQRRRQTRGRRGLLGDAGRGSSVPGGLYLWLHVSMCQHMILHVPVRSGDSGDGSGRRRQRRRWQPLGRRGQSGGVGRGTRSAWWDRLGVHGPNGCAIFNLFQSMHVAPHDVVALKSIWHAFVYAPAPLYGAPVPNIYIYAPAHTLCRKSATTWYQNSGPFSS